MQGDLYIVVTNTYLNIECNHFTATEDNKCVRTNRRTSMKYISEVSVDYRGRDSLQNAWNFVCTRTTNQLITHFFFQRFSSQVLWEKQPPPSYEMTQWERRIRASAGDWKEKKLNVESEMFREENLQGYFAADGNVSDTKDGETYLHWHYKFQKICRNMRLCKNSVFYSSVHGSHPGSNVRRLLHWHSRTNFWQCPQQC
jgi:hypothetical protein